jgi:hypothetical protein
MTVKEMRPARQLAGPSSPKMLHPRVNATRLKRSRLFSAAISLALTRFGIHMVMKLQLACFWGQCCVTKSTKIKLSLTILWAIIGILVSTNLAEDDDGFRFVRFLTTLTIQLLPGILYWLGFWIFGGLYIRRPFVWFFTRLRRGTQHTPTSDGSGKTTSNTGTGRLWLAFSLYFIVAIGIDYYSYDSLTDGLAVAIGFAIGTLAIPLAIAWAVSRRHKHNTAIYIALLTSTAMLVHGQWDQIEDAHDVRLLRRQLALAPAQDALSIILMSPTRIGRAAKSYWTDMSGVNTVLAELDDNRLFNSISLDTLKDQKKIAAMAKIAADKLAFCQEADAKIDNIYAAATDKHKNEIDDLWVAFIEGQRKSRKITDPLLHTLVAEYIDAYNALLEIYDILQREDGKYAVPDDGILSFANPAAADQFNAALKRFRSSAQMTVETRSELNKHNTEAAARLKAL